MAIAESFFCPFQIAVRLFAPANALEADDDSGVAAATIAAASASAQPPTPSSLPPPQCRI